MRLPALTPLWYHLSKWYARSNGVRNFINSIHRRGGKDVDDFGHTVQDAVEDGGVHYYLFPTRTWAEEVIFKEQFTFKGETKPFWEWIIPKGLNPAKRDKDCCILLPKNNARIQLGGTDDLSFVGKGGKSYTMSEFSLHKSQVTGFIAPILRQSQARFRANGTLRGKENQLYKMLMANKDNPDWFTQWVQPEHTKCYCWVGSGYNINPELMDRIGEIGPNFAPIFNVQDDIDSGLISKSLAEQEYLNRAVTTFSEGYYADEISVARGENRINIEVPYDKTLPVFTFWDLGVGKERKSTDAMSIWFVQFPLNDLPQPTRWNLIRYHESRNKQWADYAQILNSLGYWYGGHYAPWDINKVMAGTKSNREYAEERGIHFQPVQRGARLEADIEIVRRCWTYCRFSNTNGVPEAVEKLGAYREKLDKNGVPTGGHVHDNSSNCADALRSLARAWETQVICNNQIMVGKPNVAADPRFETMKEMRPVLGGKTGMDKRSRK